MKFMKLGSKPDVFVSDGNSNQVVRLLYTNSGGCILALRSNGKLKLWKWPRSEHNPSGKLNCKGHCHRIALSKNDVSGGKVWPMTFQVLILKK